MEFLSSSPQVILALFLGFSLACAAGFRAFLPLLGLGLVVRFIPSFSGLISQDLSWLADDKTLLVLLVATFFEIVADKVPVVDNVMDGAMTFIRPAAGGLGMFSMLQDDSQIFALVSAFVVAGGATLPIHLAKTQTRLGSTGLTAGLGNPVLSLIEDIVSVITVVLSFFLPFVVVFFFAYILYRCYRAISMRSRSQPLVESS